MPLGAAGSLCVHIMLRALCCGLGRALAGRLAAPVATCWTTSAVCLAPASPMRPAKLVPARWILLGRQLGRPLAPAPSLSASPWLQGRVPRRPVPHMPRPAPTDAQAELKGARAHRAVRIGHRGSPCPYPDAACAGPLPGASLGLACRVGVGRRGAEPLPLWGAREIGDKEAGRSPWLNARWCPTLAEPGLLYWGAAKEGVKLHLRLKSNNVVVNRRVA